MTFRVRRSPLLAIVASAALAAACTEQPAPDPTTQPPTPLAEQELMGVDPGQVTLTVPWTEQVVSRDESPEAVRATLASVELTAAAGFHRATFGFLPYSGIPGYRIAWDSASTACRQQFGLEEGRRAVIVTLINTIPADTLARPKPAPGSEAGPLGTSAIQLCREKGEVSWKLSAPRRGEIRVSELRDPPRLLLDLRAAPAAAATDTTAAPK